MDAGRRRERALERGDDVLGRERRAPRAAGPPANDIGPPLVDQRHAFWLSRLSATEVVAFRARWSPKVGEPECPVQIAVSGAALAYVASCEASAGRVFVFDARGDSRDAG